MSKRKIAVLIVCALLAVSISAASAQLEGQTSTSVIVQNLSTSAANVVAVFYPETGAPESGSKGVVDLAGESSTTFDQRYESGDPGQTPFRGSIVLYSDKPVGAVVQEMRSGGSAGVESYDSYIAPPIGPALTAPLFQRGIASAGRTWNTMLAIQNTNLTATANVTVTFTPDTLGNAAQLKYTIPPAGSQYVEPEALTALGAQFLGSALIEADQDVAVVPNHGSSDGANVMVFMTCSGGQTEVSIPGAQKAMISLGDTYFTSLTIVNMGGSGDPDPIVEVEYQPKSGTATGPYAVTVSTATSIDQRYDTHITSPTFYGAVKLTSTNGTPIAAQINLRGDDPILGAQYATTYSGFGAGVQTAYLPALVKSISSAGYSWSSSVHLLNLDPASGDLEVDVIYKEDPSNGTNTYTSHQVIATYDYVDLRYDTNLAQATFYGGAKIVSTNGRPFGVIVFQRGSGGPGDALLSYAGIAPPPP